jgi:tight adherence protein B
MGTIVFIFVNLLILTVSGILFASRFLESRGKKHVAQMLQVGPAPVEAISTITLLKELKASRQAASPGLKSLDLTHKLEDLLQQADLSWSVARLVRMMGVTSAVGLLLGFAFPLLVNRAVTAFTLAAVGAALPFLYVRRLGKKRVAAMERQLPDAMDFLARSMRGGHAFTISIGMVGDDLPAPLGREFRTLYNEQNLGASLDTAFANFLRRVPLVDAKLFCSAAMLQRRTGGNLSEILSRLSEVIRERFRLNGQVKAASAHGRMTAGILTALPALTMVAMLMVAPGYLQGMWADPDGFKLVLGAVVAQIIGNLVIRKIIRIKV